MKRIVRLVAVILGSVLDPDRVLFQKPLATPWQKLKDNKTPVIPDLILDSPTKYPRSQHGKSMSQFASLPVKRRNLLQTLNFTATILSAIVLTFTLLSPSLTSLPTQAQSTQLGPGNSFPTDKETMEKDIILNPRPDNIVDEKSRLNQNDYSGRSTTEFFLGIDNQGNEQPTPRDDGTECDAFYFKYYPFKDSNPEYYTDPIYQTPDNPTGEIQNPYVALGIPTCPSLTECTTISHQPIKNRRVGTCNDGLYTIRSQETDTAGNTGEWVEQSIERDTVKPFAPEVTIGATGDIFGQHLSLSISGEAQTTATIRIHNSNGYKKDFEIFMGADGEYSSNKFLSLVCGDVLYEVQVRLTDRAGNLGYWADIEELRTLECPRCTSSGNGLFSSPIGDNPVPYLSSDFPIRKIPGNYFGSHAGLDFAGPLGTPIYAAQSGVVTRVTMGYDNNGYLNHPAGWANTIIIRHNLENQPEIYTIYAHLDNKQLVNEGDEVAQGQLIGYMGDSGSSSGPHLHFQLEVQGSSLNPIHEGKYHKYPPQNPRDYLGDIEGNLTENQEQQHCVHDGFGDTDFAGYPETTMEEARPKIIQYLEDNFESDTIIENHTYNWAESIQQLKDGHGEGWKGQIIIHQWCTHVWVLDLQYLHQKSGFGDGGDGYDGQIIFNPYTKQPTLIKNGIWDKYQASGGPCGVVGVPSGLEGEAGVQNGSRAIEDEAWYQRFQRGGYTNNSIYANSWKNQKWNIFEPKKHAAHYVVQEVANTFEKAGGTWSEYMFPVGDTYSDESDQYCRQWFEDSKEIYKCEVVGGIQRKIVVSGNNSDTGGELKDNFVNKHRRNIYLKYVSDQDFASYPIDIPSDKRVWLVSHGWNDTHESFRDVADNIKSQYPGDIVMLVDWSEASFNDKNQLFGGTTTSGHCRAATWIRPVAQEIALRLKDHGVNNGQNINFVGHSLGTILSTEIALAYGAGNYATLLDTPSNWGCLTGYNVQINPNVKRTDYSEAFRFSRSFVGSSSIAGSEHLGASAHEKVIIDFEYTIGVEPGSEHAEVVKTYNRLISDTKLYDNYFDTENDARNNHFQYEGSHDGYHARIRTLRKGSQYRDYTEYMVSANGSKDTVNYYGTQKENTLSFNINLFLTDAVHKYHGGAGADVFTYSPGIEYIVEDFSDDGDRIKIPSNSVDDMEIELENGKVFLRNSNNDDSVELRGERVDFSSFGIALHNLKANQPQLYFVK
jgi:pimeloyl-ACP methyl ester carboxylesterase